jgi:hypothetical protein
LSLSYCTNTCVSDVLIANDFSTYFNKFFKIIYENSLQVKTYMIKVEPHTLSFCK